jgi:hypothetical protein
MATQQPSAVRFFAVDHPAVAGTVRARLEKYRKEIFEQFPASSDWGDFKFRAGRLQGIDDALQHCIDVENESVDRNRE